MRQRTRLVSGKERRISLGVSIRTSGSQADIRVEFVQSIGVLADLYPLGAKIIILTGVHQYRE